MKCGRQIVAGVRRRLAADGTLSGQMIYARATRPLAAAKPQSLSNPDHLSPLVNSAMPIIVQKFGGTSVADSQKILAAARKAIRTQQQGNQVVMVVSAMGHQTDHLVDLAGQITDRPNAREMDMLLSTGEQVSVALMAMAIQSLGSQSRQLDRRPDRHSHRQHAHQGPHPFDFDRAHAAVARRRQHRHRRRLSGHRREFQHHDARPRRQRYDGRGPGRRAAGRRLRDLHRRRRRLHDRSAAICPKPAR